MKLDSSVSPYFTFLGFVVFSFLCLRLGWIGGGLVCAELGPSTKTAKRKKSTKWIGFSCKGGSRLMLN